MRRILGMLICLALMLNFGALAEAGNGYIGNMTVVNCDEWVSMRAEPSTSAARITQIPLGATVTDCSWYSQEFIYGTYGGSNGYILAKYLLADTSAATPEPAAEPGDGSLGDTRTLTEDAVLFADADERSQAIAEIECGASVTNCHQYNADFVYCEYAGLIGYVRTESLAAADGRTIVQRIDENHTLRAERVYGEFDETLKVQVADANGSVLWETELYQPYATELDSTNAFVNDKGGDAMVMLYNIAEGLVAADAATGRTLWTLPTSDVNLGASISYAIDGYGTMYIGGYYGPDPVAVSREGEVLWQANTGREDIYWLYKIELDANDGVIGTYDAIGDGSGRVCFGWNGEVAWISAN